MFDRIHIVVKSCIYYSQLHQPHFLLIFSTHPHYKNPSWLAQVQRLTWVGGVPSVAPSKSTLTCTLCLHMLPDPSKITCTMPSSMSTEEPKTRPCTLLFQLLLSGTFGLVQETTTSSCTPRLVEKSWKESTSKHIFRFLNIRYYYLERLYTLPKKEVNTSFLRPLDSSMLSICCLNLETILSSYSAYVFSIPRSANNFLTTASH